MQPMAPPEMCNRIFFKHSKYFQRKHSRRKTIQTKRRIPGLRTIGSSEAAAERMIVGGPSFILMIQQDFAGCKHFWLAFVLCRCLPPRIGEPQARGAFLVSSVQCLL